MLFPIPITSLVAATVIASDKLPAQVQLKKKYFTNRYEVDK